MKIKLKNGLNIDEFQAHQKSSCKLLPGEIEALSASPTVEKVDQFDNSKLMLSGTGQKDLNSSTDIEATRLLVVGNSRLGPLLCPT